MIVSIGWVVTLILVLSVALLVLGIIHLDERSRHRTDTELLIASQESRIADMRESLNTIKEIESGLREVMQKSHADNQGLVAQININNSGMMDKFEDILNKINEHYIKLDSRLETVMRQNTHGR